jgi:RNA polymerase sigma factor (sigma-70 family)
MTPLLSSGLLRTQSDARLTELVAAGHERAFEILVERYRPPLRRYCQRFLSEALAEDVVQQTFMHTWSALSADQHIRDLKAWLFRVAHNAAINTLQRAGYRYEELGEHTVDGSIDSVETEVQRAAELRTVLAGVAALPTNQRVALVRTAVGGYSRADVARQLGVSDGAVGQLIHRARTTLRAAAAAVTPLPLLSWAARSGAGHSSPFQRATELMGGSGSAGLAGLAAKGGALIVTAGLVASTPSAVRELAHSHGGPGPAADRPNSLSGDRELASTLLLSRPSGSLDLHRPLIDRLVWVASGAWGTQEVAGGPNRLPGAPGSGSEALGSPGAGATMPAGSMPTGSADSEGGVSSPEASISAVDATSVTGVSSSDGSGVTTSDGSASGTTDGGSATGTTSSSDSGSTDSSSSTGDSSSSSTGNTSSSTGDGSSSSNDGSNLSNDGSTSSVTSSSSSAGDSSSSGSDSSGGGDVAGTRTAPDGSAPADPATG